jgi:septum formation inhibitor MinC
MNLKEIVSISGLSGLHKIVSQRGDGLIVHSFDDNKSRFVPNRTHIFTPLEGITLYTQTDNIELTKVLAEMKKQKDTNPPVDAKASSDQHKEYMRSIVADFDDEKVYVSDIKKLIKWYFILETQGLLVEEASAEEEAPAEEEAAPEIAPAKKKAEKAEKAEATEEKPADKKKPAAKAKAAKKGGADE